MCVQSQWEKRDGEMERESFTWTMDRQLISIILYNRYKAKGKDKTLRKVDLCII